MLNIHFKNQTSITGCIIEFEYPYGEKTVQDIIRDMHRNAERNILAIQTVKSLPGPFGLQCYSSITDINEKETMQSWYARNVKNCNLIEIPLSVSDHLVLGENIVFKFCGIIESALCEKSNGKLSSCFFSVLGYS